MLKKICARAALSLWVGLFAWVLAACGGAIVPQLPSKGGAPWRELKSAQVTLWTNTSAARAAALLGEIEERRQIISRAMNRTVQMAPIFVLALQSTREVKSFLTEAAAFAWSQRNPTLMPGVLLAADYLGKSEDFLISHELAHAISASIIPVQPPWLAEGIASYFEMANLDEGTVQIGLPNADMLAAMPRLPLLPASELLSCRALACRTPRLYITGWALLSYLINNDLDRFNRYLQRLNELDWEEQGRAWKDVFPDLSHDEVDKKLLEWLRTGSLALPRIKVTVTPQPFTERLLGDADVLAARGLLYLVTQGEDQSRPDVAAALALDRANLLAALLSAQMAVPYSVDDAHKLVAAHPDDWRALMPLYETLSKGSAERKAVFERICASTRMFAVSCQKEKEKQAAE